MSMSLDDLSGNAIKDASVLASAKGLASLVIDDNPLERLELPRREN